MLPERSPAARARPGPRLAIATAVMALAGAAPLHAQCTSTNTVVASVVALDQNIWYNRLGARDPEAMIFALRQDVVAKTSGTAVSAGNARLRDGKRPRPLTLRVNAGGCLKINFQNLLSPTASSSQPGTRAASVHVMGMEVVSSILDDGSNVGANATSLVEPGGTRTYTLHAQKEGTFLLYSAAQTTGGEGNGGQISRGLFGAVNVEPLGAQWYRSQLTQEELRLATRKDGLGNPISVGGYPDIDYEAVYPAGHALAGRPILRLTKADTLVHSELSAIITGPGRGQFSTAAFANTNVPASPDRLKPFREYTVIFHDEVGLTQAFQAIFDDPRFEYTLAGGRDAFSINYGTGGIGAEVLANRFKLGPMKDCNDCKFEDFFLSSWAVGDPAMVVDVPAAADFNPAAPPAPGVSRATRALFPEDPSNVFHSYLNDHVKIRNLHAGPKEHHVFHLHAHQWLHQPDGAESNYLDSQAIGPGGGFTYEITYGGSGNRNETVGDAILHCHFYPHFAQGMWALWRVHDVFEAGTVLDAAGRPAAGSRRYPDGEIAAGTPIPAVVPLPGYALAPNPTTTMPGFPFYIPGVAGHRPPKPPLDTNFDGGLPRHVVTGGVATAPALNTRDFSKHDEKLVVNFIPEGGTAAEVAAMNFHAAAGHTTRLAGALSTTATFETNGLPAAKGAPYADPCGVDGVRRGTPRSYSAAAFQTTVQYNKAGWSFPQHRMFALWQDVNPIRAGTKAPEPMFIRAHNGDCVTYNFVNLVPKDYEMDYFQVKTPTDVIGQHIHLVKFDVTASDGAANGWNYEDGSLSPGDVQDRVRAIRKQNVCAGLDSGDARDGTATCPVAKAHPSFGVGPDDNRDGRPDWVGAQETVQRWWVDPVLRGGGAEGRLGTVFTHDHFGPSTHQQAGLYAGLVVEDAGTTWRDPETGTALGGRADGGPTSWRADILYPAIPSRNFREFNLQIADFALAYGKEGYAPGVTPTGAVPPINGPAKDEVGLPNLLRPPFVNNICPNGIDVPPCPELIALDDPGTMLVNYRNEPIALRVRNTSNTQAGALQGDLSHAYSNRSRADTRLNTFGPYGARPGVLATDPFTPLLRAYEDDKILVRLLVGAHEEGHNFAVSGTRWLFEPRDANSGWRNSQMAGISEYYEFGLDPLMTNAADTVADFLYQGGAAVDDQWNGAWGIIRSYRKRQANLYPLETNRISRSYVDALNNTSDATVDGYSPTKLDASAPTTWEGTEAQATSQKEASIAGTGGETTWNGDGTMSPEGNFATIEGTSSAAQSDSVVAGYGTVATGGLDYTVFEYDPATQTEYVATDDPDAPSKGMTGTTSDPEMTDASYSSRTSTNEASQSQTSLATSDQQAAFATTSSTVWMGTGQTSTGRGFYNLCPRVSKLRYFEISAVTAANAIPGGTLKYNTRTANGGPLHDPTAILYVYNSDLDAYGKIRAGVPIEPLVLRANAGDCIHVRLFNKLPSTGVPDQPGYNTLPPIVDLFNANQVVPSNYVGLHPQLVAFDVQRADGHMVGVNRSSMVAPGYYRDYIWYAGDVTVRNGRFRATPIEFGAINLTSSDRIKHSNKGAIASLIIEPQGTRHIVDSHSRATATIVRESGGAFLFREQVLLFQDDVNLRFGSATSLKRFDCADIEDAEEKASCSTATPGVQQFAAGAAVPNLAEAEDPEDSGQKGLNYRTEPLWFRKGFAPNAELHYTLKQDFRNVLKGDSAQTPIFNAQAGQQLRIRLLQPGGHARNHVYQLHGHTWRETPYLNGSSVLGNNPLSELKGSRDGHGPTNHHDILPLNGAGGKNRRVGDYLYRDQASFLFDGGIWGILRVKPATTTTTTSPTFGGTTTSPTVMEPATYDGGSGGCTVDASTGKTLCN